MGLRQPVPAEQLEVLQERLKVWRSTIVLSSTPQRVAAVEVPDAPTEQQGGSLVIEIPLEGSLRDPRLDVDFQVATLRHWLDRWSEQMAVSVDTFEIVHAESGE